MCKRVFALSKPAGERKDHNTSQKWRTTKIRSPCITVSVYRVKAKLEDLFAPEKHTLPLNSFLLNIHISVKEMQLKSTYESKNIKNIFITIL